MLITANSPYVNPSNSRGLGIAKVMAKEKRSTLEVQGLAIAIVSRHNQDYISLTDIARHRDSQEPFSIINNWMRGRSTIEFLGLWETLNNPDFKPIEFERFSNLESLNSVLIRQNLPQSERLVALNQIAITQMRSLLADISMKRLK